MHVRYLCVFKVLYYSQHFLVRGPVKEQWDFRGPVPYLCLSIQYKYV